MKHQYNCNEAKGSGRRHADRIIEDGGRLFAASRSSLRRRWRSRRCSRSCDAERGARPALVAFTNAQRTVTITVTVGKSEDVRTDQSFVDIMVGDPEVADVNPLTDHALSILGKKIGTTRVTVYGEGKKLIGIFDVEVSYDISRLADRDRAVHRRRHQGVVGQRPHHAVRHRAATPSTLDKAVTHRPPVRARRHQHGAGDAAAAGDAGGALRRGTRQAGRDSACSGTCSATACSPTSATRTAASSLPVQRPPAGSPAIPAHAVRDVAGRRAVRRGAVRLPRRPADRRAEPDRRVAQCARAEGRRPQPGRAEPGRAVGRHRELPRRRRISDPGARRARPGHDRIQEIRRRPRLHADRAERRPDQPEDRARGEPARLPPIRCTIAGTLGAAADRAARQHHGRTARRPELRDRRPAAEQQPDRAASRCRGSATCRCSARCSAAPPTRRTRPISPSSSRRVWCARRGPATRSARRSTTRCRPTTSTSS